MPQTYRKLPTPAPQDIERFWFYVDKTPGQGPWGDCWGWKGACCQGYGYFWLGDKTQRAARVVYLITTGDPGQLQIRHRCANRPCVNPQHLLVGTAKDNADDRERDGHTPRGETAGPHLHPERMARGDENGSRLYPERLVRGELQWKAKLTESAVREMRKVPVELWNENELAAKYGVKRKAINDVRRGKRWKHVQPDIESG